MEIHEAAELFPLDESTIPEMAEDIKKYGLRVPIVLHGGKLLDGRRRLRACEMAGVEPRFAEVTTDDPFALSWSLNGERRQLSTSQKGMVAARMRGHYEAEAKERQRLSEGRGRKGPANLPDLKGDARDRAGEVVGVSGKTVDHAAKVIERAVPEVVAAVDEGRMAVSAAAALADEPEEVQRAEAAAPKRRRKQPEPADEIDPDDAPPVGKGMRWAFEATKCLRKIPPDDPQRAYARRYVENWLETNM